MFTIIEYCTEEVRRQGFNTNELKGLKRTGWMIDAWTYARDQYPAPAITVYDIGTLGHLVEPEKNDGGFRKCGVRVGTVVMPEYSSVPRLISGLLAAQQETAPFDFYRRFLEIHPFVDGNGRVGKVLLNWKNGTLMNPVFPPNDFWGGWIENP